MRLAPIFSDGMILQAGKEIRIFGTGGGKITIDFEGAHAEEEICAVSWCVTLPAMDYGGPYTMQIDLDGREKTLRDIYIGDVYLLAGQSNMQFKLAESNYPASEYRDCGQMRLFTCERMECGEKFFPEDGWVKCALENAADWPCIGYIMGSALQKRTDHAIGLVACYQGAAAIQSYLPDRVFADRSLIVDEEERYDMEYKWNKGHSILYHYMFRTLIPFSFKAVIWYQGESNCSEPESILYEKMLRRLIATWREDLRDAALRFVIVQIADFIPRRGKPWSRIQEAQLRAGEWDNVDTVICADVCENDAIHPVSKTALSVRIADVLS